MTYTKQTGNCRTISIHLSITINYEKGPVHLSTTEIVQLSHSFGTKRYLDAANIYNVLAPD